MKTPDTLKKAYAEPESVGTIMSVAIPVCGETAHAKDVLKAITKTPEWDSIHYVYVINRQHQLLGYVKIWQLVQATPTAAVKQFMRPVEAVVGPDDDQEKAIFLAVKHDLDAIPVVNKDHSFLGAVTATAIIDVMHDEHLEDALMAAGIRRGKGTNIVKLASERLTLVLASRAPWLFFGAIVGLGLGFIASFFEASLEKSIAIAYFIPVVAYIADSVGTQSEAIAIRALATLKLPWATYLLREIVLGFVLGILLGLLGMTGAWIITQSIQIGIVVGLSLIVASTVAAGLASLIPIIFKKLGKDPALGSGPLATAAQDVISVMIYFLFAMLILG